MRALFIIDPVDGLKPYKDSSIDLMVVGATRGVQSFICEARDIATGHAGVTALARPIHLNAAIRDDQGMTPDNHRLEAPQEVPVAEIDAVFIRKDPPFDQDYLTLTLMLSGVSGGPVFINDPKGVLTLSEKLSALRFPDLVPPTLVSYDVDRLAAFAAGFEKVVLKSTYLGSGDGIYLSAHDDPSFRPSVENILSAHPQGPVIAQGFLPEIVDGDARVMIVDGEVVGAVGRKPPEGDFRANIAQGGAEFAVELSPAQRKTAETVAPFLKDHGILFAGIDLIGDRLIEMNVTSPTLIQELRRVGGPDVSSLIWDAITRRQQATSA